MLLTVSAIAGIFRFYMRRLLIGVSRKIEYDIRKDLFSHIQTLDPAFFLNNKTGSIMALITNDLDAVRNFLGPGLLNLFNTTFIFISTLIVMFFINVKLTLYTLIAVPLLPIIVSRLNAMLHQRFKASQEHYAYISGRTQENLAGIKVVKSFAQEEKEISLFSKLNKEYIAKNMSLAMVRSIFWSSMIFIGGIGSLVVLLVGGRQVISNNLTLGQFVQFSAYIISITWPLISLGWVINLVQRGEVSMGRINNIFNIKPKLEAKNLIDSSNTSADLDSDIKLGLDTDIDTNKKDKNTDKFYYKNLDKLYTNIEGDINFEGVYFKFLENQKDWVLKNINVEIPFKSKVGIVGFTGSGKTALVNLIPRLYEPQKGKITIVKTVKENLAKIPIELIPVKMLRENIGYVTQDVFIFSKTIKENIIYGKEEYFISNGLSEQEIEQLIISASKIAHLHEDVETFPNGYDTLVGERGIMLSGGQKQRLAIARALIIKPSILILDDSFSSIDTQTEELILQDLKKVTKDVTTIIISHRISTIKEADLILVLDSGQIIDKGSHKELIKKCDIYQRLYKLQQLKELIE